MNERFLIATLCGLALLSTVGASLPYPMLAPLFADGSIHGLNSFLGLPPKLLLGIALMINPLGLLIGSAVLGPLSDGFGRRRTLLLTTVGAALGHLLTAVAMVMESYLLFLAARFFTGLLEGNGAIMRALVIERVTGRLRNHALSWLNGSFNLGWLVGPLLGGFTMTLGAEVPFGIAALALLLGTLCVFLTIPATPPPTHGLRWWTVARERHALTLLRHAPLRTLFIIHLGYCCGVASLYEYFPLWLVDVGGYDARQISIVNMGMCALMTTAALFAGHASIVEGPPARRLVRRRGRHRDPVRWLWQPVDRHRRHHPVRRTARVLQHGPANLGGRRICSPRPGFGDGPAVDHLLPGQYPDGASRGRAHADRHKAGADRWRRAGGVGLGGAAALERTQRASGTGGLMNTSQCLLMQVAWLEKSHTIQTVSS